MDATSQINALTRCWQTLLRSLAVSSDAAQTTFDELVAAYTHPTRHYHSLPHIWQVLQTIDQLNPYANDLKSIQLAAWFHDVIYNPQASDNETRSAAYASACLARFQVSQTTIAATTRMILHTQSHRAPLDDLDSQILLDADLAILASPPETYQHYATAIRREYDWLSEADYRLGRQRVLTSFLQREKIFHTPWMQDAFETIARQNLKKEIETLRYDLLLPS